MRPEITIQIRITNPKMSPTRTSKARSKAKGMKVSTQENKQEVQEEICKVRYPTYPPKLVFGKAWLACVENNTFVFDAEKMLLAVEEMLGCSNRKHSYFVDMKQYLYVLWRVPEFKVFDSDYPDTVGACYPTKTQQKKHDKLHSEFYSQLVSTIGSNSQINAIRRTHDVLQLVQTYPRPRRCHVSYHVAMD